MKEKILLAVLPMWEILIPPLGISCIKEFFISHGFNVKTVDANTNKELKEAFDTYFSTLRNYIPESKRSNFYNICHDVVHEHMMAHINQQDHRQYIELVKTIIFKTFFCDVKDDMVHRLKKILEDYYRRLESYFLHLLDKEKPGVLGLSVYSSTLPSSLFAFRITKEKYPHIRTVMGGGIFTNQLALGSPNLEFFLEKTNNYIDKIIIGEGETLFLQYLRKELPENQRVYTFKDIKQESLDLSLLGVPDYSDFDLDYYQHLAVFGARGCPINCKFCSETVIWGKYRKKDAAQIAKEMKELHKQYSFQLFLMCDSLINPIISDLSRELIMGNISIYWDGYLRAEKTVGNIENTLLWRRGGFYRARLGLESGSQKILDAMAKRITREQIIKAVSSLAAAGIKTTTYWIVGYPGETEEDFQQTLDLIKLLKDDIYEVDCNPFGYSLTGQVNSHQWKNERKPILLYPETAKDMLITQTWILDGEPSREETYRRLNRLVEHCQKLKIPNPYSIYDIYNADLRWKNLHPNAVPALVEFEDSRGKINDNRNVKKLLLVENIPEDEGDFSF